VPTAVMEVETGDGTVRHVSEPELPAVLRAALDAGLTVRLVRPLTANTATAAATPDRAPPDASAASRRAGGLRRIVHGSVHRARLLTMSQWFAAPALLFLIVLGILYASSVGPLLPAAAFTAVVLAAVMTWVSVLVQLVDGRLVARAFTAHVGGRGRAHLAACLATTPFAVAATAAAIAWPVLSQPAHWRSSWPFFPVATLHLIPQVAMLHLAAAVLGVGAGTLLVPPLVERAGWRICLATAIFLALLLLPVSPMHPLLLLTTGATRYSVGTAAGLLAGTGAVLIGLTTFLASRLP
jgi:hypothetical protein